MFPEVVRATRELQPRAVLVENVKGLLRQSFAQYFEYILLQLSYPEIISKPDEDWVDHLARLEQHHTAGMASGLAYRVVFRLLNAADFGVPQRRERVFIVGFRSDLGVDWSFPDGMHTHDALLQDQWVTGAYWERHRIPVQDRPDAPARLNDRIVRLRSRLLPLDTQPWATVRDAIADLPDPEIAKSDSTILNHRFNPGARTYHGHTGSPLDEPAKTLKAGDHGVPGGENIVVMPDGRVRYFTVRESARLQTFPDAYAFRGSWSESMRQLGNAVPVSLARIVAGSIAERLTRDDAGPGI
jgi:DNA (cytosine-5)-methyltransferase 1